MYWDFTITAQATGYCTIEAETAAEARATMAEGLESLLGPDIDWQHYNGHDVIACEPAA